MKLNARMLHLPYMVYLQPKHNSLLAWHIHIWHDMYKVGIISEVHGTIPLVIPFCLENPSPAPDPRLLTRNPSFACGAIPVHPGPRLLVYWPPLLFSSPSPLFLSPTVPHFKYMPSYDDITTSASHSLIQFYCMKTKSDLLGSFDIQCHWACSWCDTISIVCTY